MNSAAIDMPVTEPSVIRIRLGGIVSVCAPVAASSADEVAAVGAALLHLGKQRRRDRRHVGGLGAGDARHEIHRGDQHVVQPAADMAEQIRQEPHHHGGHAGHLDQQAEEHEQRDRQQDEVRHPGIEPRHQHRRSEMRVASAR